MAKLVVKNGRLKPILNRHPWIFSGAIAHVDSQAKAGDLLQVIDENGRFLAQAYYNPKSQIQGAHPKLG